jgi:hypothetical protein
MFEVPSVTGPSSKLAKHRLSNNVGGVKHLLSVPVPCTPKSAISLSLKMCQVQPKLARKSVFRSGTQSDPCISSIATSTMILSSNSSVRRSGTPSQLLGVRLHTMAIFGLSRVRTESVHLLVVP